MAGIKIGRMVVGMCGTNCYLLYREGSDEIIFVDPADNGEEIYKTLTGKGFYVKAIFLTHGHFDHIWGSKALKELTGAPIYALEEEKELCMDAQSNVSAQVGRPFTITPENYMKDGEEITVAGMTCRVIATPGHTAGSCCFYFEEDRILVSGDTLFKESVGRTDFPTGSSSAIVHSIREKLFVLPDNVLVYPGHGESTTIGHEKMYNPFCS